MKSIAFITNKPFNLALKNGVNTNVIAAKNLKAITFADIHISTSFHIFELKNRLSSVNFARINEALLIENEPAFTKAYSHTLQELAGTVKNVAILNGLGTGVGDTIIGLSVLRFFIKEYQLEHVTWHFILKPSVYEKLAPLYLSQLPKVKLFLLPIQAEQLTKYDFFLDFADFLTDKDFVSLNFYDYFLKKLGLDYLSVANEKKRMMIDVSKEDNKQATLFLSDCAKNKKTILLSFDTTSPIRNIPLKHREIITNILNNCNYTLIADKRFGEYSDLVKDISEYSQTLNEYFSMVKNVDYIISADTATYHIADAFDKKTLTIFTTIDPELRTKYYPENTSVIIPSARQHRLWGHHKRPSDYNENELIGLWSKIDNDYWGDILDSFFN